MRVIQQITHKSSMTGCKMAALALMESDMQYVAYLNFDDFVTVDSYFVCIKLES